MERRPRTSCFIPLIAVLMAGTAMGDSPNSYHATTPSSEMQGQPRVIRYLGEKPDDLEVDINFVSKQPLFGQIRYGTADSIRVGLVVDPLSDRLDEFDFYIDLNRDRKIEADEKIDGEGRVRQFELKTEINQGGKPSRFARQIRFRRSSDQAIFSVTTLGGYQSVWKNGESALPVWRVDGDGNGLFSDNKDEIWIDANQDGKWNPIVERYPFRPALIFNGDRFAIRGDELGTQLAFEQIVGEGQLLFDVDVENTAHVESFRASVFGDDGSCYSLDSQEPVTLPVGNYTLGQFTIKLKPLEGQSWTYSFSHSGQASEQAWYTVDKDGEATIPLFGELQVEFSSPEKIAPGNVLDVRPNLKTQDGLYITYSGKGKPDSYGEIPQNLGHFSVTDAGKRSVGRATSGFA